ncbi:lateral flagellin LafA [Pseudomonas sp. CAN2814]|uniref:lateral flagellin LafA n=1 Tax=Pseudomonas sp. CAN1 TaxID=3046726 RepID=UPI0026470A5F|nr:lateral flagellin LafA [Pseudomonas sp. CAN1]MDN6855072.1 lateral flagellin LafA [Pseudomonas sp. CAN1]
MALSIQTNYSSLITQSNLGKTNNLLATNQQRLGTGLRINSAADDAAGLQIATRLNAQSRGMDVAMRNTSDAISLMQTADGSFSELTDITQRMKDLSTQAANGTNTTDDGKALSAEFNELGKELKNIIANTKFGGDALFGVDGASGKFGTTGGVTFQIGSDKAETLTVDVSTELKAVTDAFGALTKQFAATSADGTELETISGANDSIDLANDALDAIGALRAQFGANINRLQHTSNNLANMKDNTDLSKGRIMDADFAVESANMSKNSMLMQSGISMLKQAGQMPSMIMGLLG